EETDTVSLQRFRSVGHDGIDLCSIVPDLLQHGTHAAKIGDFSFPDFVVSLRQTPLSMSSNLHISDFLEPINLAELSQDQGYKDGQIGKLIDAHDETLPDLYEADIVLVGCDEERGIGRDRRDAGAPDAIREQLYQLYYWHSDVKLADAGNIRSGATLNDTYAALKTVLRELTAIGKTVVILGGSHDLTLAQYYTYADKRHIIEATGVDALIDLDINSLHRADNFLMEMLT